MCDDDSGYDLSDPKHPTFHERYADQADHRRKADRENARRPDTALGPPTMGDHEDAQRRAAAYGEPDIRIVRDGELMVAQAEGVTEAGEEFIDAYMPASGQVVVPDAGRIVLRQTEIGRFADQAREYGLDLTESDIHDA